MKRHWTSLFLLISPLLVGASLGVSDRAVAAVKSSAMSFGQIALDTGGALTPLQSVAGLGFGSKGPAQSKGGARSQPTSVDVWFGMDSKAPAFMRAQEYLSGKLTSTEMTVQLADQNYAIKQVFNLGAASITELELPGVDARNGKARPALRLRLQPQVLELVPGSGTAKGALNAKAVGLVASNFRVSLDGSAAPEVASVSPCVVRRAGSQLQIEGLGVSVGYGQAFSGEWLKWSQAALTGKVAQKTLVLEYLDPTLKNTLLSFEFTGVTLEGMDVPKLETSNEQVAMVTFKLSANDLHVK